MGSVVHVRLAMSVLLVMAILGTVASVIALGDRFSDPRAADIMVGGALTIPLEGLLPGDHSDTPITLRSDVGGPYQVRVKARLPSALTEWLRLRIVSTTSGRTMYDGPLADFVVAAGRLRAGTTERLAIGLSLPLASGNEAQGVTADVSVSVTTSPDAPCAC